MKKTITLILMCTCLCTYSQINYKKLIRNLEEINFETDIEKFFKELRVNKSDDNYTFKDERFLRFHGVIVDDMKYYTSYSLNKVIHITPFNNEKDALVLIKKLTQLYGEPTDIIHHVLSWGNSKKTITLEIEKNEDNKFEKFREIEITLRNDKND
ncbi:MAG: hypothetical protein JKY08_09135 [Flavobacteriaceae bacterium]|nr:hypothetical protein [Flavobacteriaceae bacterium]